MRNNRAKTIEENTPEIDTILIADVGSTKADWMAVGADGPLSQGFTSQGFNASTCPDTRIREALAEAVSKSEDFAPVTVYLYGAGCGNPMICSHIAAILKEEFKCASAEANSDMLGAARALLSNQPGIACILGTGSNTCLYNGTSIIDNIPPMGCILGDEGSGAYLGKQLLNALYKRRLPTSLLKEFEAEYALSLPKVIEEVYRKPAPGGFLGSLAPFILEHIDAEGMEELVADSFNLFITNNLLGYHGAREVPVAFVGSVAFHFRKYLREALQRHGLTCGEILRQPIQRLAEFHQRNEKSE